MSISSVDLALATLVSLPDLHLDGVILIAEPGRSLDAHDVAAVVDVPVVVTVPFTAEVSRSVDAGLLAIKVPRVEEFQVLEDWARRPVRDLGREQDPGPPRMTRAAGPVLGRASERSHDVGLEVAP